MAKLKMYANKYGIPAGTLIAAATLIAAYQSEWFKTDSGQHAPPLATGVAQAEAQEEAQAMHMAAPMDTSFKYMTLSSGTEAGLRKGSRMESMGSHYNPLITHSRDGAVLASASTNRLAKPLRLTTRPQRNASISSNNIEGSDYSSAVELNDDDASSSEPSPRSVRMMTASSSKRLVI